MRKIVFVNTSLQNITPKAYESKSSRIPSMEVAYSINACLFKQLEFGDDVKVVIIKTCGEMADHNEDIFKNELNEINSNIGADIEYKTIELPMNAEKKAAINLYKIVLDEIEENSILYADITFGPRYVPMVLMGVFSFAEVNMNCQISCLTYAQVQFVNGEARNPEIHDVSSLYFLNNISHQKIKPNDEKSVKQMLKEILDL